MHDVNHGERVPLSEVRDLIDVDEPLPFRVLDEHGRLLLNLGQVVISESQFTQLLERGAWVERPRVEEVRLARTADTTGSRVPGAQRRATLFDLWERAVWDLDDASKRLGKGTITADELSELANRVVRLTERDADIALFGCIRQDDKRFALYALVHGLHCAVAACLTARVLKWDEATVRAVVGAAVTMNAPIAELQAVLAEQKDPPSKRQMDHIRAHPHGAAALLRRAGVTEATWLAAVEDHHERLGGGGYPRGVAEVGEPAQLLRIVDVYMAKVSPRASRPAMPPQQAARELFQQSGQSPLAMAVIRSLGAHPPGAIVQLASGEIAVVVRRPASGTAPLVSTLTNRKGEPISSTTKRDTAEPAFAVIGAPAKGTSLPRVLPERVYGLVPAS